MPSRIHRLTSFYLNVAGIETGGFFHSLCLGLRPFVLDRPLLVLSAGIHHLPGRTGGQLRGVRRLRRIRIDAKTPRREELTTGQSARRRAAGAGAGIGTGGEQTSISLLLDEQRNILENVTVIQALAGPQNVFAGAVKS